MPGSVIRCPGREGFGSSLRRSWAMYCRRWVRLGEVRRPPHLLQQLPLADQFAGLPYQDLQQLPFGLRQVDLLAAGRLDHVPVEVDGVAADAYGSLSVVRGVA